MPRRPSGSCGAISQRRRHIGSSAAQVARLLDRAPTERTTQQVLIADLGGAVEAAGAVIELAGAPCQRRLALTTADVRGAIAAAPAGAQAAPIAATPLVVSDMLTRAECRRRSESNDLLY